MRLAKVIWSTLYIANFVNSQKVLIIQAPPIAKQDLEDVNNPAEDLLPGSIDYRTAAPDPRNYEAILSGKWQLDNSSYTSISPENMHSIALQNGIPVAHFGLWNFDREPQVNYSYISNDPKDINDKIIHFMQAHPKSLVTYFMPLLQDSYIQEKSPLRNGKMRGKVQTYDKKMSGAKNNIRYQYVSYILALNFLVRNLIVRAKQIMGKTNDDDLIMYSPIMGPLSANEEGFYRPKNPYRGTASWNDGGSLYDGGTNVVFKYFSSLNTKFIGRGYSVDVPTTVLDKFGLHLLNGQGINLADELAVRKFTPRWHVMREQYFDCFHVSPPFAKVMHQQHEGMIREFKVLWGNGRLQVYPLDGTFELLQANFIPDLQEDNHPSPHLCSNVPDRKITNDPTKRDDVELIIEVKFDDLGWGDFGAYSKTPHGRNFPKTKNIDYLANNGIKFLIYYSPSSVCSTSRVGAQSGVHPSDVALDTVFAHLPKGKKGFVRPATPGVSDGTGFVARDLRDSGQGWSTIFSGKDHMHETRVRRVTLENFGYMRGAVQSGVPNKNFKYLNIRSRKYLRDSSEIIMDHAIDALDAENCGAKGKKCYLSVWFQDPHGPFVWDESSLKDKGFSKEDDPTLVGASKIFNYRPSEAIYGSKVASGDIQIERLMEWVDKHNKRRNLFMSVTSDNGPEDLSTLPNAVGRGGLGPARKRETVGGQHVPMIWYIGNGSVIGDIDERVSGLDWRPTVNEIAGTTPIIPNKRFDPLKGVSIKDCVFNGDCDSVKARTIYSEAILPNGGPSGACYEGEQSLGVHFNENFTCIMDGRGKPPLSKMHLFNVQCFDTRNDPGQTRDLVATDPAIADEGVRRIREWTEYYNVRAGRNHEPRPAKIYNQDTKGNLQNFACRPK